MNGRSWIRWAGISVCAAAVILLQACPCPKCPEPTPVKTTDDLGGPAPGPIIDTGGGAGTELTYAVAEHTITPTIADTDRVDGRLIANKVCNALLVDTDGVTNGTKRSVFGLENGVVVTYTFSDGESYSVTIGNPLVYKCSHAAGNAGVTLKPGNANEIPQCMSTTLVNGTKRTVSNVETSQIAPNHGDILIIH